MTTSERGLSTGRLASFEDGEEMPTDLTAILGARPSQRPATAPVPAQRTLTESAGDHGPDLAPESPAAPSTDRDAGEQGRVEVADPVDEPSPRRTPGRSGASQRRRGPATGGKSGRESEQPSSAGRVDHRDRANVRKTSVFHLPTELQQQVIQHRAHSGLSNGQIVIAAIEQAHPRLGELVGSATVGGGGLFTARVAATPQEDGPVSPLNVSMFAADFEVIDELVSRFKASSRTQLVRVSLEAYFAAVAG